MEVNPSKTELMSMQDVKIDVRLTSGKLDWMSEMKVLGIVFDDACLGKTKWRRLLRHVTE